MLAYVYPLLNLFWTLLWIFAFAVWVYLLVVIFADIFRSRDMGGWGKAAWFLLVLIMPVVGILIYMIARGSDMGERAATQAQQRQAAFDDYIRHAAHGNGSNADELAKLADLRDAGKISEEEYAKGKEKILQ